MISEKKTKMSNKKIQSSKIVRDCYLHTYNFMLL